MKTKQIIEKQAELIELDDMLMNIHAKELKLRKHTEQSYKLLIERNKLKAELLALQSEIKPKKKRSPSIKIIAACGSFARGNPGHDISIHD